MSFMASPSLEDGRPIALQFYAAHTQRLDAAIEAAKGGVVKSLTEVLGEHTYTHPMELFGHEISPMCSCGEKSKSNIAPLFGVVDEHAAHVAAVWREARTVRTEQELDALPVGTVVRTANPNCVPSVALWTMMGDIEPGGPWWLHSEDDSYLSKDVLYGYGSAQVVYLPTDEAGA